MIRTSKFILFLFFLCSGLATASTIPSEWQDRFAAANQAMTDGDWESAVKIQESLVGEGFLSVALLKNLAIARAKQHQLPQSLASWLAAKSLDPLDPIIQEGLTNTLAALQLGPDAVDLSAHGPITAWLAKRTHHEVIIGVYIAIGFLLVSVLLIGVLLFGSYANERRKSHLRTSVTLWIVMTMMVWTGVIAVYVHMGSWGVVIDPQGAPLRIAGNESATELTRLKSGTPVFVTNDTYSRWLAILTSDGQHGYVDAFNVRVIRISF